MELDEIRYNQVHIATIRLLLVSTIMTVLSHLTGSVLRDYEAIKTTLKSEMIILLDDFPEKKFVLAMPSQSTHWSCHLFHPCRKLKDILISLSEQVVKTTREQLAKYDKASIITNNEGAIKDAIRAIGDQHVIEHAVFKLLCKFDVEAQRVIPRTASLLLLYDLVQRYVAFVHQLLDPSEHGIVASKCGHTEWTEYRNEWSDHHS